MIRIWGRRGSSSVQKVMWPLAELGVEHEREAGYGFGVTDSPAYLAKNPNGTIPTPEEPDGFTLWESNAIVRYLAARYGNGTLSPIDLRANARACPMPSTGELMSPIMSRRTSLTHLTTPSQIGVHKIVLD